MLNNKQTNANNTTPEQFASKQKNWIRSKITWNLKKRKEFEQKNSLHVLWNCSFRWFSNETQRPADYLISNWNVWTHIIWIYREYFAIKILFKFRLLGLDFCFYIWPRIENRHDSKSTVYFDPRAPDTRIKSPYLFITCLLCIAKYRFFFSSQTFLCIYTDYIFCELRYTPWSSINFMRHKMFQN